MNKKDYSKLTIKQLEKLHKTAVDMRQAVASALDEKREAKLLPEQKALFEGKCFTYDNGYNNEDRWPIYVKCYKVIRAGLFMIESFQIDSLGIMQHKFEPESRSAFLFATPIHPSEWETKFNEFTQKRYCKILELI